MRSSSQLVILMRNIVSFCTEFIIHGVVRARTRNLLDLFSKLSSGATAEWSKALLESKKMFEKQKRSQVRIPAWANVYKNVFFPKALARIQLIDFQQ